MKSVVALALGIVVAAAIAAYLRRGDADNAPSPTVFATAAATATPSAGVTSGPAAVFVTQVAGMRGCGQPVFVTAGGLPPGASLQVERADLAGTFVPLSSTAEGTAAIDARSLFSSDCAAGNEYALRINDGSGRVELARASLEMPLFQGTIEVAPGIGGCSSIGMTVRGMPEGATVQILATDPRPFAYEGVFLVLPQPLVTDDRGLAQSAPVESPWECDRPAVSLVAFASAGGQSRSIQAELLYRIALGPDEPIPSVEGWLRGGR